ncbi:hypothetical protein Tco_0853006, partial [Tanacetum coccineum]
KDVFELKRIDLSAEAFAALKTQVPSVVHNYLGSKPPARPNQGKNTKRRRTKESESSKKPSTTKETSKGKAPSKGSKTGKSASTKEPEEPIIEVIMDDVGDDVVHDDDQPQDASVPKTTKTLNPDWFTEPLRTSTPDLEWNKHQVVLDQPEQPWFNQMVSSTKHPLTFNDLMATPIDFSKYVLNRLKIDNRTQDILLGPAYNLLKGDRYPFDLSKPLPLQAHPGHLTIAADYFFNNNLEYLKSSDLERTYTTSITKTKAAQYKIEGIKDMVLTLWSPTKVEILGVKSAKGDFVDLYVNDIEDMLLLAIQHKVFHLTESDIVDFIMALCMFTRSLVIKKRVEDLQLGVESYQKKLNINPPQQTFPKIEFKELYTPSHKPPGVKMDDSNITMEEYISLRRKSRMRWYGVNCETVKISFDESDDEDYTVIYNKNSFSYKIIFVDDLKTDSENDNDKVNMPSFPSPGPTISYFDDLDYFKVFEKEFPAIVYNDALTSQLDFLTEPTVSPQQIDEFNLKDETSLSKCDEDEQNVLNFNDLFPFNVIYPNNSKSDKDNDDDKIQL